MTVVRRWAAAAFLDTEKNFRKSLLVEPKVA